MPEDQTDLRILSIDVGGSHIKATVLNKEGEPLAEYARVPTPLPAHPQAVIQTIQLLVAPFTYQFISVGFPGYVKDGVVFTAPNLGTPEWSGIDLSKKLQAALGKPARVVNDADMQGLGVVDGKGFELVITLGTGFGSALLQDGFLLPHLELAHHPVTRSKTYDTYVGEKALKKVGKERWNERVKRVLEILKTVFNYDTLYIGGGNASRINFPLDSNMRIITNREGIKGGSRLWLMKKDDPMLNAVSSRADQLAG